VTGTLPDLAPDLRAVLERHADRLDLELVDRALRFSASAHRGQKRMSGEDFVSHTIAVALILAEQLLDSTTIVAALLHDVVEDSDVRMEDIAREFGPEVAGIVDGLTKISSLTFNSSAEEQVENYRKLLLSIAKDARVIIIKLGDRLHNMRTLEHSSSWSPRSTAISPSRSPPSARLASKPFSSSKSHWMSSSREQASIGSR
jgi:guanosine-3',5'-bis(diphosphate) 3'-pyrophosphohydrolase